MNKDSVQGITMYCSLENIQRFVDAGYQNLLPQLINKYVWCTNLHT